MNTPRRAGLVLLAVIVTAFVGACAGDSDEESAAGGVAAGQPRSSEGGGGDATVSHKGIYGTTATNSDVALDVETQLPGTPPRVIKTADIRLEVPKDEFRESVQESVDVAQRNGGFVNSTTVSEDNESGSVTIRVPSEHFEVALGQLKDIGDVTSETISGTDVTQEFVDLEARKRNLEAQETVLLNLMEDATSISGTIKVQRELQPIQLEIEQIQGRMNYLSDQTDMSTITVSFGPAGVVPAKPANAFEKAWENAKDVSVTVFTALVVGAGFVVPIALLLGLGALVFRWLRPRFTPS